MQSSDPLFSVVICTYNRSELLVYTLNALVAAEGLRLPWELIVIDNNSSDDTAITVQQFAEENPAIDCRYVLETRQGLSHARNRGYLEAAATYVMYLDDDAKVHTNFLQRIEFLIRQTDYQIVGGVYYPWYHYGKPDWYKDEYGSNAKPIHQLSAPGGDTYACGGVMLWKKALLADLGGFDPKVGMIGKKIAYGEETFLQMKAQERGVAIAYDPELIIYHIVAKQKLDLDWFFISSYAKGRDFVVSGQISNTRFSIFKEIIIGSLVLAKDLLVNTPKMIFDPQYHLENWLIDTFKKVAKRVGSVYTLLKSSK